MKAADFYEAMAGDVRRVLLHDRVAAEYDPLLTAKDHLSVKRRVSLKRYFERFCSAEQHQLQQEQYKPQGSFQAGRHKIQIWEFKAWKFRIYGATVQVGGKPCFVGVRVDPNKKKEKADQKLLQAAADDIAALDEFQAGKR